MSQVHIVTDSTADLPQDIVEKYNGILIPAHIFTPFKSYYGNCADRIKDIFKEKYDENVKREIRKMDEKDSDWRNGLLPRYEYD